MNKKILKSLLLCSILLFTGCDELEKKNIENYNGGAISLGNNVYVKKMIIQDMYALLYCDKDGNVISNNPISTHYMAGKVPINSVTLVAHSNDSQKYTFECDDINECYNEIMIIKKHIGK